MPSTKTTTKRVGPVAEVTKSRNIKDTTRWLLWGKAAGRCEFSGCNRELWKSPVTQETSNIAEAAHIYAFSSDGSRGNKGIEVKKVNDLGTPGSLPAISPVLTSALRDASVGYASP
jgi:hypothetical protein